MSKKKKEFIEDFLQMVENQCIAKVWDLRKTGKGWMRFFNGATTSRKRCIGFFLFRSASVIPWSQPNKGRGGGEGTSHESKI